VKHSGIGPSSCGRWLKCPGSVKMLEDNPLPDTEYNVAGTEFHKECEKALKDLLFAAKDPDVEEYRQVFINILDTYPVSLLIHGVEKEVQLKSVAPDAYGTPDAYIGADFETLHVFDVKSGWQYVSPDENEQLMYYALAIIETHNLDPSKVILHIYQPSRDEKWKEADVSMVRLWEFLEELKIGAQAVKSASEHREVGAWCEYCNKAACPEFKGKLEKATGISLTDPKAQPPDVNKLDNKKLAQLLEMEKLVTKMFKEAAALAKSRAMAGEKIPGKKLVKATGNRQWKMDTDFDKLAKELKIEPEEFYNKVLVTAPAFEAVVKANFPGRSRLIDKARNDSLAVYEKQIERPDKGAKLVSEATGGETYLPEAFADIE